jgi:chorismate-pyruvate lyase
VNGEEELARLLSAAGEEPIESGATALFEAVTGGRLTASVLTRPARRVAARQKRLLRVRDGEAMHVRAGVLLCPGGVPVAQVTTLVVSARIPDRARASLGVTSSGTLMPVPGTTPLGRALRGLGVRREQRDAVITPGCTDAYGARLAVRSTALLRTADGTPLAWVIERIFARFLEAFPPPWPCLQPTTPEE